MASMCCPSASVLGLRPNDCPFHFLKMAQEQKKKVQCRSEGLDESGVRKSLYFFFSAQMTDLLSVTDNEKRQLSGSRPS